MGLTSAIVAQDIATAVCGLFNAGYFTDYWWRYDRPHGRRLGAVALTLVSVAAVAEALFSQGLLWWREGALAFGAEADGLWVLLRLPLLLATMFISLLVARRLLS